MRRRLGHRDGQAGGALRADLAGRPCGTAGSSTRSLYARPRRSASTSSATTRAADPRPLSSVAPAEAVEPAAAVIDVTRYPDIGELYLAADVAGHRLLLGDVRLRATGRPMLFYAYDLEAYRDDLRGFYFDYEPAPGPIC